MSMNNDDIIHERMRVQNEANRTRSASSRTNYDPTKDPDNIYRQSLLDPNKLPTGLNLGTGMNSMDVTGKPTFATTEAGNIMRTDYLTGGRPYYTLIPNNEWQKGGSDAQQGDVYRRQLGVNGAQVTYRRGDQMGTAPSYYNPGAFENTLANMLRATQTPYQGNSGSSRQTQSSLPVSPGGTRPMVTGSQVRPLTNASPMMPSGPVPSSIPNMVSPTLGPVAGNSLWGMLANAGVDITNGVWYDKSSGMVNAGNKLAGITAGNWKEGQIPGFSYGPGENGVYSHTADPNQIAQANATIQAIANAVRGAGGLGAQGQGQSTQQMDPMRQSMMDDIDALRSMRVPEYQSPDINRPDFKNSLRRATQTLAPRQDEYRQDASRRVMMNSERTGVASSDVGRQIDIELEGELRNKFEAENQELANSLYGQDIGLYNTDVSQHNQAYQNQIAGFNANAGILGQTMNAQKGLIDIDRQDKNDFKQEIWKMRELGLEEMKVALAEKDSKFNEWLGKQKTEQGWKELGLREKSIAVDSWLGSQQNSIARDRLALDQKELDMKYKPNTDKWTAFIDEAYRDGDIQSLDDVYKVLNDPQYSKSIQEDNVDTLKLIQHAIQMFAVPRQ
jgi:hypothetical protein